MLPLLLAALSLSAGDPAPPLRALEILRAPTGAGVVRQLPQNTPMVVEFWASWCGPCVEAIPRWNTLAQKFEGRLQFIAVSAEDPETVAEFLAKRPMAGWVALDVDGTVHSAYGVETVPRTFLVDAHGVVRGVTTLSALRDMDLEALAASRAIALQVPKQPGEG